MDERAALSLLAEWLDPVGDDAAVVDDLVVSTDMLHERTDFPPGTTRFTAGWRAVAASLSDVAAMGATATCALAVYAAPRFDETELAAFIDGARAVCERVGAEYVGGDLDHHDEFTVATTALGRADEPVGRDGAEPGDVVCVTGTLGRTVAAMDAFQNGDVDHGNELFRFLPRVQSGVALAPFATAMMDSSDGLARSLHQLADASSCGFTIRSSDLPLHEALGTADRQRVLTFGEDFELVVTLPADAVDAATAASPVPVTVIGEVTATGVGLDGEPLPDEGYTH